MRDLGNVFPAYAGMSRSASTVTRLSVGFPRLRGDEPLYVPAVGDPQMFSPPTRG